MPEDRYAPIAHAVALCRILATGPHTRDELAVSLGMHERSVRRLIDALRASDVCIAQSRPAGRGEALQYSLTGCLCSSRTKTGAKIAKIIVA